MAAGTVGTLGMPPETGSWDSKRSWGASEAGRWPGAGMSVGGAGAGAACACGCA